MIRDPMFRDDLLAGQRVLVTGAGTGLGREIAAKYLSLGAVVWICGRRGGVLDETAKALKAERGGTVMTHAVDLRNAEAVDAMVETIWAEGPLTGLVNNAAGNQYGRADQTDHALRRGGLPPLPHHPERHAGRPRACGPAAFISHLKKAEMAREAEALLGGTGWLPQALRTPGFASPPLPFPAETIDPEVIFGHREDLSPAEDEPQAEDAYYPVAAE